MERASGRLLHTAAMTEVVPGRLRRRLISLQSVDNEMSAQVLTDWQTVIRVIAHEAMTLLTPISSLARRAHDLVQETLEKLPGAHRFA